MPSLNDPAIMAEQFVDEMFSDAGIPALDKKDRKTLAEPIAKLAVAVQAAMTDGWEPKEFLYGGYLMEWSDLATMPEEDWRVSGMPEIHIRNIAGILDEIMTRIEMLVVNVEPEENEG